MSVGQAIDLNKNDRTKIAEKQLADAHAVKDMAHEHRGWSVIGGQLSERIANVQAEIEGGIEDHGHYLRLTGELKGLRFVAKAVEDCIRQATEGGPEHGR